MRIVSLCLVSLFAVSTFSCGSDDEDDDGDAEPFDTLEECVDEHVNGGEGFTPDKAVTICCLDHPIGGADASIVCTTTQAGCEAYVDANLGDIATSAQIAAGCADYLVNR